MGFKQTSLRLLMAVLISCCVGCARQDANTPSAVAVASTPANAAEDQQSNGAALELQRRGSAVAQNQASQKR